MSLKDRLRGLAQSSDAIAREKERSEARQRAALIAYETDSCYAAIERLILEKAEREEFTCAKEVRRIEAEYFFSNELKDSRLSGPVVLFDVSTSDFWSVLRGKRTRINWCLTDDGENILRNVMRKAQLNGMVCHVGICVKNEDGSRRYDIQGDYEGNCMDFPYDKLNASICLSLTITF